jgi:hypothetical protein
MKPSNIKRIYGNRPEDFQSLVGQLIMIHDYEEWGGPTRYFWCQSSTTPPSADQVNTETVEQYKQQCRCWQIPKENMYVVVGIGSYIKFKPSTLLRSDKIWYISAISPEFGPGILLRTDKEYTVMTVEFLSGKNEEKNT